MRVCLVSRELMPFWGAGIGVYARAMARAWADAGHDVHVLTAPHPALAELAPHALPRVHVRAAEFEPETGPVGHPGDDPFRHDFMRHAWAVRRRLDALHAHHPFDYIEFPDYFAEGYFAFAARRTMGALAGAVLGLRLHTPTRDCRDINAESWLDERLATLEYVEDACIRHADLVVSPSRALRDRLAQRLGADAPQTLASAPVVPYPFLPDDLAQPAETRRLPRGVRGGRSVVFVGRLERRKGVESLVRAAVILLERRVDAVFTLVGADTETGPGSRSMLAHLRRLIPGRLRGRIEFAGPVGRPEAIDALRRADLVALPSLWDNFPNALLEAMALGACIVSTDAGGIPEIIESGVSGLLVPPADEHALADAIGRALADDPLRARLGLAAQARVRDLCDPPAVVRAMERAIADPRPAAPTPSPPASTARVSVVIPHHDLARFLPEAIDSVRAQTRPPDEVIVVDDGSTERASRALLRDVERARGRWEGVRLVRKPNGGLSSARNAGLHAASSPWIVFLDADDLLHPRFLELTLAAAERGPGVVLVATPVAYFHDEPARPRGGRVPIGLQRDMLAAANVASSCTALLDRQAVLDVGGYDEHMTAFEDWELYCALAERGGRSVVVPEFLFHYRYRPESMLRSEGVRRRDRMRAHVLARHPGLPLDPDRALRLLLAQVSRTDPHAEAVRLCEENLRYRVVDRLNHALRRTPLHAPLKELAHRVLSQHPPRT
jgi:glycosyltransferase involved in cell wall biosynthesis/GT2 family glycosyltransferase